MGDSAAALDIRHVPGPAGPAGGSAWVEWSNHVLAYALLSLLYESLAARPWQLHGGILCCCQCRHMLVCGHWCITYAWAALNHGVVWLPLFVHVTCALHHPIPLVTVVPPLAVDAVGVVSSLL